MHVNEWYILYSCSLKLNKLQILYVNIAVQSWSAEHLKDLSEPFELYLLIL